MPCQTGHPQDESNLKGISMLSSLGLLHFTIKWGFKNICYFQRVGWGFFSSVCGPLATAYMMGGGGSVTISHGLHRVNILHMLTGHECNSIRWATATACCCQNKASQHVFYNSPCILTILFKTYNMYVQYVLIYIYIFYIFFFSFLELKY